MSYSQAQQNPEIAQNAPVALAEAGRTLRQAEDADDEDETTHLAYIAQRKVEIARAPAETRKAEAEARQLLDEREKLRLQQELAALQATQTERGLMVTLGDVLFAHDKADLRPGAQQRLYQLGPLLTSTRTATSSSRDTPTAADRRLRMRSYPYAAPKPYRTSCSATALVRTVS
jgi:outer membrane protein OmpA-like peptidoglycan-associated protein